MNHAGQVIVFPSILSMWPTAIMFCAAAVFIPTFHKLSA